MAKEFSDSLDSIFWQVISETMTQLPDKDSKELLDKLIQEHKAE